MSTACADNAARDLLARLIDEAELETAPIDDVRADLALLGVDPARAIRFSRRLSEEAASPAGGLLARSLTAEDSDRELSALERADISAVQAELSTTDPLGIAYAHRLANAAIPTQPRRSSRRLWYGVGGAITAIAASVLIFIAASPPELGPQQMAFAPPEAETGALRMQEPQAEAPASPAPPLPPAAQMDSTASRAPPASSVDAAPAGVASISRYLKQPSTGKAEGNETGAGSSDAVFGEGGLSSQGPTDQAGVASTRSRSAAATGAGDLRVVAALILQPELAPEPLRRSDLAVGDLTSRLAEAARFAGRKNIIALVTLEHADGRRTDEMLMHLPIGNLQGLQKSEAEALGDYTVSRTLNEFDMMQPTLRQLLGKGIDQFQLIEMQPPAAAGPK